MTRINQRVALASCNFVIFQDYWRKQRHFAVLWLNVGYIEIADNLLTFSKIGHCRNKLLLESINCFYSSYYSFKLLLKWLLEWNFGFILFILFITWFLVVVSGHLQSLINFTNLFDFRCLYACSFIYFASINRVSRPRCSFELSLINAMKQTNALLTIIRYIETIGFRKI